jgi:putative membrane protein
MSARLWWVMLLTVLPQAFFMILEMFFWDTCFALNISGLTNVTPSHATTSIGRNMGLYNGLLAAGLAWSIRESPHLGERPVWFFVGFMAIAGIFGGLTINPTFNVGLNVNPGILLAQGGCALAAMFVLRYMGRDAGRNS